MQMARHIFRWAGIYGLIVLAPMVFFEARFGQDNPPALTHVEFYYGFAALALAWQVAFLIIGSNPPRFRPLMIAAILEKFGWGAVAFGLTALGRAVPTSTLVLATIDVALGVAFVYARQLTPNQ
jgi:hypothetical protein